MNALSLLINPVLLALTLANPGGGGQAPDGERPRHPPREALDACADKDSGDSCSFTGREDATVEGTCFSPDDDKPLACRPDNAPDEQR